MRQLHTKFTRLDKNYQKVILFLEEAKKLHKEGATFIACHSHTTDFMKGHPTGTTHITCLVPKDHKRADMPMSEVDFDVAQLPEVKNTPIVTYCASNNWWKSYHAARLAVKNDYSNVYWMRDGIKGWKHAGYDTVGNPELLEDLIALNKNDFSASIISETEARKL